MNNMTPSLLLNWLRIHKQICLLVLIGLFVGIVNYQPGAYLSGWDTLHPEFNLGLYAERVIFGAWQEHQGLGAPASQAHAAELPRLPILFLLQLLLPEHLVRYVFFIGCYILGGIGTYLFISKYWFEKSDKNVKNWSAFFGALLFQFNLGTLQHFYVPLEMFAVHYATLGFVLMSIHQVVAKPSRKSFSLFFIVQFFTAPSAHTATLFYMYMMLVGLYTFALTIMTYWQSKRKVISILLPLAGLVFLAHAYWIGPNLYYVLNHSEYVSEAKISRHFSSEAFWQNQAFGNILDVVILRNFLFNWKDYNFETGKFQELFDEWNLHLSSGIALPLLYIIVGFYILGVCVGLHSNRKKTIVLLLCIFLPAFFFLNNLNFPSRPFFEILQNSSETLKEALRFPFTKFSILFMFCISVFFAQFAHWVLETIKTIEENKARKYTYRFSLAIFSAVILYSAFPILQGNLISNSMKVHYPKEYEQAFAWLNEQPRQSRIAKFPLTSFYGWTYHQWPLPRIQQGYQGAGFIWFGSPQPILDREFDRWVETNEYFYLELQHAVNTDDPLLFQDVLEKYQVTHLLYDSSTVDSAGLIDQASYKEKFDRMVEKNQSFQKVFSNRLITIYQYSPNTTFQWLSTNSAQSITSDTSKVLLDPIYSSVGSYVLNPNSPNQFPFADLMKPFSESETIEVYDNSVSVSSSFVQGNYLQIPSWGEFSKNIPTKVYVQKVDENIKISFESDFPTLIINNQEYNVGDFASFQLAELLIPLQNDETDFFMDINGQVKDISVTTAPQLIGSAFLPIDDDLTILLYSKSQKSTSLFFQTNESRVLRNCNSGKPSQVGTFDQILGGVEINASQEIVCLSDGSFAKIPTAGIIEFSFLYESNSRNTSTRMCIFERDREGCVNYDPEYTFKANEEIKKAVIYEKAIGPSEFSVSLTLDAQNSTKNIRYKDVSSTLYPLIHTETMSIDTIKPLAPQGFRIPLPNQENHLTISNKQPRNTIEFVSDNFVLNYQNCATEGEVAAYKSEESYLLSSRNKGVLCATFSFLDALPSASYFILTDIQTVQGKEPQIFIKEAGENYQYLEEVLERGEGKNFHILSDRKDAGLFVTVQSPSYGKLETINEVHSITLAPFPIEWSANIRTLPNETLPELKLSNQKRLTNFLYTGQIQDTGLITLSQSFDSGWIAFPSWKFWQQYEHVKYNGWANGWIIDQGLGLSDKGLEPESDELLYPKASTLITILYWPQLLSFLGYGLLIVTFGWFGVTSIRKQKITNRRHLRQHFHSTLS